MQYINSTEGIANKSSTINIIYPKKIIEYNNKPHALFKTTNHHYSVTRIVPLDKYYKNNEVFAYSDDIGQLEVFTNEELPF